MTRIIEDTELFNEIEAAMGKGGNDAAWDCLFDSDDDGAPVCKEDYNGPFLAGYFHLAGISHIEREYILFKDQNTSGQGDGSFQIVPGRG